MRGDIYKSCRQLVATILCGLNEKICRPYGTHDLFFSDELPVDRPYRGLYFEL